MIVELDSIYLLACPKTEANDTSGGEEEVGQCSSRFRALYACSPRGRLLNARFPALPVDMAGRQLVCNEREDVIGAF